MLADALASQGGYVKQGIYIGILVGLCSAICCVVALCKARRRRANPRKGTYTPYGEADDAFGMEGLGPAGPDSAD